MSYRQAKALLFDFDGILIDTESPALESWQEIFDEHGHELGLSEWASCLGTVGGFDPIQHLETLIGARIDDPDTLIAKRSARQTELLAKEMLRPGVESHLESASELGLKVAIVSSDTDDWITMNLDRVGWEGEWHHINCANGDRARAKPLPVLYEETLEALELSAEEAIAFEDSPNGIRAAKEAGLFCVVVSNQVTATLDLSGGDLLLRSFEDMSLDQVLEIASRSESDR